MKLTQFNSSYMLRGLFGSNTSKLMIRYNLLHLIYRHPLPKEILLFVKIDILEDFIG